MANEIHSLKIGSTTYPIQPEYSNIAGKVNRSLKAGTKSYDGSSEVTITASDLGLSSALKYIGITSTSITDGSSTTSLTISGSTYTIPTGTTGQVVFYDGKEFVWNGSQWELLGDDRSFKVVQSAVSSPSASGSTTAFIDTISQNANGVITATKKNVSFPTIGNGTVAITQNGVNKGSFTMNQSGNTTIELTDTKYNLSSFGITATATELNYTDGVTSNIQTQLNGKQATISDLSTIRSNANNGNTAYGIIKTDGDGKSFLCNDGTYKKMYVEGETMEITFVRDGVTPSDLSIKVIVSDSNGATLYNNIHISSETVTFNVPSGTTYTIRCSTPDHYCSDFTATAVNNYRRIVLINLYELVDNGLYAFTQNKELLPLSIDTINKNTRDGVCLGYYGGVLYDIKVVERTEDTSWQLWGIKSSIGMSMTVEQYADSAIEPVLASIQPPNETNAYTINYSMASTLHIEGYIPTVECYLGYYYVLSNSFYLYAFPGFLNSNTFMDRFSGKATTYYSKSYIYMVPITEEL